MEIKIIYWAVLAVTFVGIYLLGSRTDLKLWERLASEIDYNQNYDPNKKPPTLPQKDNVGLEIILNNCFMKSTIFNSSKLIVYKGPEMPPSFLTLQKCTAIRIITMKGKPMQ